MEGELVDSVTGEQIGAVIRWGSGSRILRAGFTHIGDAKIVINRWAMFHDGATRPTSAKTTACHHRHGQFRMSGQFRNGSHRGIRRSSAA